MTEWNYTKSLMTSLPINIHSHWFGLTNYRVGLELQDQYAAMALQHAEAYLLGFEHEPVISLGIRGTLESDLNWNYVESESKGETKSGLEQKKMECLVFNKFLIQKSDRGGQATIHHPGQLVVYPIVSLKNIQFTVQQYVEFLMKVSQIFLAEYGIEACCRAEAPGLYTKNGKILSVGLRNLNGVIRHGIAINVSNDLSDFQYIRACGIQNASMDQMQAWGVQQTLPDLFSNWSRLFQEVFQARLKK